MKIFAVNPTNTNSSCSLSYKYGLKSALNFKGQDFLDLSEKDVLQKVKESVSPENFIGQGTEAEVYKIKDTNYCVRIPYNAINIYGSEYTKELKPADKINHIVARLGFGITIMKYFSGQTPKENISNEFYRNKFQEKIAEMPLKSYTELLHQIANGINNEMIYDFSGGNLIVDFENNKLTAIDFYRMNENSRKVRPLSEMYSVLTCYGSKKETGKKIFDRIILTGLEEFKPDNIPCMDLELFDFVDLALKRNCDSNRFGQGNLNNTVLNLKQLTKNNTYKYERLISSVSDSLTALKELKKREIIDKTLSSVLTDKITEFKRLITKIH